MRLITWNVKGLRSPGKRSMVLRHLKRLGADVALLQETHLEDNKFFRLRSSWVGGVYGSSAQSHKAGVVTLLHKNVNCEVLSHQSDSEGR